MPDLDHCPTCGKRILDNDRTGCETPGGQRWCIQHLMDFADQWYGKDKR
jgi:hypothetical protein